ncbi:sigma-54-dependent Fis family transcriptional regulator [Desulfospira joergensenii]|uniref:sigma-54-dependent Fis family transcriptional regulator n=1 Tax=Desulfospira joergensenii TaxID=53329 RepID=UPI0003B5ECFB|nr:sigma-54-dependent Fis family transcriptional regulator [Desulfospira joergensenii]
MNDDDVLSFAQKLPVAIYRCTKNPEWEVEFLNDVISSITGHDPSHFSGRIPRDYTRIIHPDDRDIRTNSILRRATQFKNYDVEYRIIHADGKTCWVHESGQPVIDRLGNYFFMGTIYDTTLKRQALRTLHLNESRLSTLWELNQMTGVPLNEIIGYALEKAIELTESRVGYFAFVHEDQKTVKMYSWSTAAILQCELKHKQKNFHIDHMGLWGEALRQRKPIITNDYLADNPHKRGQPEGHAKIYRHMNVPTFDQDRVVSIAGVGNKKEPYDRSDVRQVILLMDGMWNIIRRKQVEDKLRENELKYRSVFEHAGAPSLIIEGDLTVSMANLKFNQFSGFSRQEIENKIKFSHLIDCKKAEDLKIFLQICSRRSENEPYEYECSFVTRDGVEKDIVIKLGVLPDKKRCIASFFDITQSKQAQARLRKQEESLRKENLLLKSGMQKRYGLGQIVGKSTAMQEVYNHIIEAGASDTNVIVYGESGTGKELVSRAIHDISDRRGRPFISVNCSAVPEHLLESEFFGHKKGAFTGAYTNKTGYMEQADGGSLFLDEVGEIALQMQVKLLRAIEGNGFTPVGGMEVIKPDIRIIAATNRDLFQYVNDGKMRKDFFYRIHIIPIDLPPLRKRKEDIPLLIQHFLHQTGQGGKKAHLFTSRVLDSLAEYDWPGNVRELQNVFHRYITLRRLDFGHGAVEKSKEMSIPSPNGDDVNADGLRQFMERYEKEILVATLERNQWNRTKTASMLKINRKTLFKKLKLHGIN